MRSSAHDSPARAEASTAPNSPPNVSRVLMDSAPASLADATTPGGTARGTGGRLLADPRTGSPTDPTACVGVWLPYAPPVTTTCLDVVIARRPWAYVYVGHLYTSATFTDAEASARHLCAAVGVVVAHHVTDATHRLDQAGGLVAEAPPQDADMHLDQVFVDRVVAPHQLEQPRLREDLPGMASHVRSDDAAVLGHLQQGDIGQERRSHASGILPGRTPRGHVAHTAQGGREPVALALVLVEHQDPDRVSHRASGLEIAGGADRGPVLPSPPGRPRVRPSTIQRHHMSTPRIWAWGVTLTSIAAITAVGPWRSMTDSAASSTRC